jgi:L-asparaginase type II
MTFINIIIFSLYNNFRKIITKTLCPARHNAKQKLALLTGRYLLLSRNTWHRRTHVPSAAAPPATGTCLLAATALTSAAQAAAASADKLAHVTILATGGTIAGSGATSTTTVGYTAATVGVDRLIQAVPELAKVAQVKGEQVFQIASENASNEHWLTLAKRVNTLLAQPDVDGIVITHGTDTLENRLLPRSGGEEQETRGAGGRHASGTALSADGPINLYNAVLLAASQDAVGKGVLVALNDQIHAARDVTKTNTSTLDSFKTPELGMLGYIQGNKPYFYHVSTRKHTVDTELISANWMRSRRSTSSTATPTWARPH